MHRNFITTMVVILLSGPLHHLILAQENLRKEITVLMQSIKAEVGVAIKHLESGDTLTVKGHGHFPMQSVFKFHLGLAVLSQVDKGTLTIDKKILIEKKDLRQNTWSPIAKKFPEGNVSLTIKELLEYTVGQSDNNGCDILFKVIGGTSKLEEYIHSLGVKDIAIVYNEEQMQKDWEFQFSNWTTPIAMNQLLEMFYQKKILKPASHRLLVEILEQTPTGPKRLKGLLPPGTVAAHKTGTGDENTAGLTGAVNDVGVIALPDGEHIIISVFVTKAQGEFSTFESTIARISKLAYDHYNSK